MFSFALFAQQKPAGSPFDRPELLWGSAGLAGALLVGAIAIYLVDKWRRRTAMTDPEAGLELSDFRAMFETGQITKPEYDRLRQKVADRVKKPDAAPASSEPPGSGNPKVVAPFPPGYFDDPPTSPTANPTPPTAPGGTAPPA